MKIKRKNITMIPEKCLHLVVVNIMKTTVVGAFIFSGQLNLCKTGTDFFAVI